MSANSSHNQESWAYEDGTRRVRMEYSQQSWSTSGQSFVTSSPHQQMLAQSPLPAMPAIEMPTVHHMHSNMHAAAIAHHQSAMQHFNNVQQAMQANMGSMFQNQLGYTQPSPQQLPTTPSRLAIGPVVEEVESDDSDSSEESGDDDQSSNRFALYHQQQQAHTHALEQRINENQKEHSAQRQAMEQQYIADQQQLDAQRRAMQQRYEADQQSNQRQGAIIDDRLRKLEERETKNRAEQEAKDREMRQLREENNRMTQQRFEDAEKHKREMAELVRMQAHSQQQQQPLPTFDTTALEKVIREVQAQQLSKADIEKVIQERVSSQLDGLARQKDVEAAGSRMQKALSQLPSGASAEEVQRAVNQELGKAVGKLASKIEPHRKAIEGAPSGQVCVPAQTLSQPVTASPSHVQQGKLTAIPLTNDIQPTLQESSKKPSAVAQFSAALVKTRKSKKKDSSDPSHGLSQPLPVQSSADLAVTKVKKDKKSMRASSSDFMATQVAAPAVSEPVLQAQPGIGALLKIGKQKKSSKSDAKLLTQTTDDILGKALTIDANKHGTLQHVDTTSLSAALPDDFPDNASQITTWERSKAKKSGREALPGIPESLTPDQALVKKSKHDKGSKSSTIERSNPGALVRGDSQKSAVTVADIQTSLNNMPLPNMITSLELPEDFPDNASQISTWERARASSKQPTLAGTGNVPAIGFASGSGHESQAVVRSGKSKKQDNK